MKRLMMFLAVMWTAAFAYGADEMSNLDWLVGDWKGEATARMGPGKAETIMQTEKVTPRAGGKVLLVEGLGRDHEGKVVHDAVAFISWDEEKKTYRFIGHVADKPSVDTTLDMTAPNTFVWGLTPPEGGKVRFTIRLTERGEWNEIGEFSPDGTKWFKMLDMTLTKVK
jgi:hypothetical protein